MNKHRDKLRPYMDERVECSGVFHEMRPLWNGLQTALVSEIVIKKDGSEFDFGHTWIQRAEAFAPIPFRSRVQFNAVIGQYKESSAKRTVKLNLNNPQDVVALASPPVLSIPLPAVDIPQEIRRLAREVGGIEKFTEIVENMRDQHRTRFR